MATLTDAQMIMYAAAAGLPNPPFWAKVGRAESGGRTDVVNSIGATGWLQINQPVHIRDHPTWTKAWLKDPLHNAMAAKVLYQQSGLAPWKASRAKWGPQAQQAGWLDDLGKLYDKLPAWPTPGSPSMGDLGTPNPFDMLDKSGQAVNLLADFASWIADPKNWLRVLYGVGGAVLVVAGLYVIAQPTIGKAVAAVPTPVGNLAKQAGGAVKTKAKAAGSAAKTRIKARSGSGGSAEGSAAA